MLFCTKGEKMAFSKNSDYINIGKLTSAVGIRGEIRVMLYAGESDNLKKDAEIGLALGKREETLTVTSLRYQNGKPVIKLSGYPDRTAVEALRNAEIYIRVESLEELPEGEFYIRDLIGFEVYDRSSEQIIGSVTDYISNRAQALWEVTSADGRELLIPDVDAFVREIRGDERRIEVELIPGFLE